MATLAVVNIKDLIKMKLMRKYSIGAFPNKMMMFSNLSGGQHGGTLNVVYNAMNQEDENNQTQMLMMNNKMKIHDNIKRKGNFSKYFDVLLNEMNKSRNVLMTIVKGEEGDENLTDIKNELLEYFTTVATADKMENQESPKWVVLNNIPLLNLLGHVMPTGAVASVTYEDNKKNIYLKMIKQKTMAILNLILNENTMMKEIHNSNNKKLTNNCKIEINTENINFSFYCDEYYEIIFNVSVFLSQKEKVDIMQMLINGSITMNDEKLQSHIQSFIVTDVDEKMRMITKSSITSQSNTNKSEYAFEKTLNKNNENDKFYVAIRSSKINDKRVISFKSTMKMPMTESTSKLFFLPTSHHHFFSFFMQLYPMMNIKSFNLHAAATTNSNKDDDDEISVKMQLNCQKSLQSLKESELQSGIVVVSDSCKTIKLIHGATNHKDIKQRTILTTRTTAENDGKDDDDDKAAATFGMQHAEDNNYKVDRMNINELLFSHINDKNETLIDKTVNITCDFNYLNYKIKNDKINDQNRKDSVNVKVSTTTLGGKSSNDKSVDTIDQLIAYQRRERQMMEQFNASGRRLRLCGGGGDSLSGAGASGWGSPPSNPTANPNNPNAGNWGATAQQTPQQNWSAAQQAAGVGPPSAAQQQPPPGQQQNAPVGQPSQQAQGQKPLTPSGGGVGWANQPPQNPNQVPPQAPQQVPPQAPGAPGIVGGATGVAAKNQLEQLNSMREALFSQDGWGCQNVNQDSNWDVPGSPEPGPRGDPTGAAGATQWKSHTVNNGTELWEANLRNGGQPPPQPVQKTPWNHTPSTNIGGTWGEEDDDSGENASVWNNQNTQQPAPGWNQPNANSGAGATNVWPPAQGGVSGVNANIPKKDEWGSNITSNASNWDPRAAPNAAGGPMDVRSMDPRDPRASGGNVDMRMMDARDQMQGNLRGVTGRLGPTDMWNHNTNMPGMQGMNKIVGPNAAAAGGNANNSQWPGGPKDIDMSVKPGWDASPPAARRAGPIGGGGGGNFDDGTSLWNQNRVPGGVGPGGGDNSWKGVQDPMGRNNFNRNPIGPAAPTGLPPNRLPGASVKPDVGNAWGGIHPGAGGGGNRNTWDEGHNQNWDDKSHLGGGGGGLNTPWNNEGPNAGQLWNKPNKPSWPENDITNDWPNQNKLSNTSSEIIRSSKPFRILVESGFKKDDAELALRNTNMNLEEAMDLLQQQQRNAGIEPWHQQPTPGGFDHSPFPGNRYPGPQMPFPPNNQKLPNANAGPGANMGLNNIPMPFNNKHLPHPGNAPNAFPPSTATGVPSQSGQPSAHHLRNLVQQIQKAVQAGYLNHQILNQPLAPQTLQLLNSLLNAIQQLQATQQNIQRNGGVNNNILKMAIQNQKQQISALQSQISQQQALYIKSQGGSGGGGIGSAEFMRQNSSSNMGMGGIGNHNNDPIVSLENNLSNLGLKQDPTPYTSNPTSQQSRLNQWKLPSAIDNKSTDPDFSRAPGTTSSKQSLPPTTPTSISSIGMHSEPNTWSSGRNDGSGGWPDTNIDAENKDWPSSNQSPAFTDLVPEFQPGKPWKGTQKNIEDDPSITPGSVARNPLSISAAKESELFGNNTAKTSPNEILSSSTWSFNPSTTTQQNFSNSTMSKLGADSKNNWSDSTSELWAAPTGLGKTAGPPPGLGASKNAATSESNDWMNWNSSSMSYNSNGTLCSTWLLLKNLTAQIDGSTLRTLCVQHGPLLHFHLYLNHGIALCKYNSREEASKAQQALNNCVLSNTTICAESPNEGDVQNILSHLGVPAGGNGNGGGNGGTAGNGNGSLNSAATGQNASTWRPPSQQSGPRANSDSSSTWGSDWPTNSASNW